MPLSWIKLRSHTLNQLILKIFNVSLIEVDGETELPPGAILAFTHTQTLDSAIMNEVHKNQMVSSVTFKEHIPGFAGKLAAATAIVLDKRGGATEQLVRHMRDNPHQITCIAPARGDTMNSLWMADFKNGVQIIARETGREHLVYPVIITWYDMGTGESLVWDKSMMNSVFELLSTREIGVKYTILKPDSTVKLDRLKARMDRCMISNRVQIANRYRKMRGDTQMLATG